MQLQIKVNHKEPVIKIINSGYNSNKSVRSRSSKLVGEQRLSHPNTRQLKRRESLAVISMKSASSFLTESVHFREPEDKAGEKSLRSNSARR